MGRQRGVGNEEDNRLAEQDIIMLQDPTRVRKINRVGEGGRIDKELSDVEKKEERMTGDGDCLSGGGKKKKHRGSG